MCFGCDALHLVWIFSEIHAALTAFSLTPHLTEALSPHTHDTSVALSH